MKKLLVLLIVFAAPAVYAQYTHADSLRGGYGETRDWWDVTHYELDVTFNMETREFNGSNTLTFSPAERISNRRLLPRTLQIDLQEPLVMDSIVFNNPFPAEKLVLKGTAIRKDGNAYFIAPAEEAFYGARTKMTVYYHGKPRQAVNPPWDGGVIWKLDHNGTPWMSIACQGLGASVWYPCKDSQADEIDGAEMHFTCPTELACISNGRFEGKTEQPNGMATYSWKVLNPINNYCIIPYVGDYVNIHEHFPGEKGMLDVDYWVIRGNEERAKEHFTDVPKTLEAMEHWFGPYPFYEDGYKLIEAPHLGMEHQGAIAYGNRFRMGYSGKDLSGTGEGIKWDFIIVHETGHEWFGNNITTKDIADMWVHEGFTDYSETLFTEYWFGQASANKYIIGLRRNILNEKPIIGPYGVNTEGSGDMYYKGANMLHTIRQLVGNDSVFRGMLRGLNETFYHQTVTTDQIEQYMIAYTNLDLGPIFDQYLREKNPPTLELVYKKKKLKYRWINVVDGFGMPVYFNGYYWLAVTEKWHTLPYRNTVDEQGESVLYPVPNENLYLFTKVKLPGSFYKKYGQGMTKEEYNSKFIQSSGVAITILTDSPM